MPTAGRPRSPARRALDAVVRAGYRRGFRLLHLWWRLTHPTLEGVYVAVWHDGRVLLIRNSYHGIYSFPSGRRGRREPPVEAAARELREEVGIDAAHEAFVHVAEWTIELPILRDHVHVYELHLDAEPEVRIDHREVVWAGFEPPEQAHARRVLPAVDRYLARVTGRPPARP